MISRLGWLGFAVCLIVVPAPSGCHSASDTAPDGRKLIENGLLPAVVIENLPQSPMSLRERMVRYRVPGVSIALVDGGRIEWVRGYGETGGGDSVPVTADTRFQAASLAKMVTAAGTLRLVQEKQLDLDADVNRYLESWRVPENPFTRKAAVTIRRLLSHTAGITVGGFPGYAAGERLPAMIDILDGRSPANSPAIRVDDVPGGAHRYSGGGYLILQQLMADVSGRPYERLMEETILRPAGMDQSGFDPAPRDRWAGTAACGHGFDGRLVPGCWRVYPELAAAGLWSTSRDLARLGLELAGSINGTSDGLLSPRMAKMMLERQTDGQGLGPGVHGNGRELFFDHAGWNRGFRAYLRIYPYRGQGIAVMANGDGANLLVDEIVRAAARAYDWPGSDSRSRTMTRVKPGMLASHAGEYEVAEYGLVISVTPQDDHLVIETPRGSWYTFYPASDHEYFAIEDGSGLVFSRKGEGSPREMRLWGMTAVKRAGSRSGSL